MSSYDIGTSGAQVSSASDDSNASVDVIARRIVDLTAAYAAKCLDHAKTSDEQETYRHVGAIEGGCGDQFRVDAQLFPSQGEATEHSVVFAEADFALSVESVPEFVRMILTASREACKPSGPSEATAA